MSFIPIECNEINTSYLQADVTYKVSPEDSTEDITFKLASQMLQFIKDNKPLWQTWKEKRAMEEAVAAASKKV